MQFISFAQEISLHCLSTANKVVLGMVGPYNVRVTLPACAVKKIRDKFPSSGYKGFKL